MATNRSSSSSAGKRTSTRASTKAKATTRKATTKTSTRKVAAKKAETPEVTSTKKETASAQSDQENTTAKEATVLGEAAITAITMVSTSALAEVTEQLVFDYEKIDSLEARSALKDAAISIKTHIRKTYLGVIDCGRKLVRAKELVPKGTFMTWFREEFKDEFTYDTCTNYLNLAKARESLNYSDEELMRMPLATLYKIFRSTVPEAARVAVINASKTKRIGDKEADNIIKSYRSYQLEAAQVRPEVREFLIDSPVSEDPDELKRLTRLSVKKQLEVAEILSENNQLDLRDVLLSTKKEDTRKEEDTIDAEVVAAADIHNRISGNWLDMVNNLEPESIDLCFCEMPLGRDALQDYGNLAQALWKALKPGGMLLTTAGQQNIQFLGPQLDPLTVAWTFFIRRRPGNSTRVIGRISYASSVVPLSLSYKPPLKAVPGLIDDLRTDAEVPPNMMSFHFEEVQRQHAESMAAGETSSSIEGSINYYLQRLLAPTDVFLHLIPNRSISFGVEDSTAEAAFGCNAGRVITALGV